MTPEEIQAALEALAVAASQGVVRPAADRNIRQWLCEARYREFAPLVAQHIAEGRWAVLNDVFWTTIPFGTAGRRGRMYPIGCNAINERTIGETAQGLANGLRLRVATSDRRCAVAYDTRHQSRELAELCGEIMAAADFLVYFFAGPHSTPELAFAVRDLGCACGIMISASHNPPQDNAIKIFGSHGGQVQPPEDVALMRGAAEVGVLERLPFADARRLGRVVDADAALGVRYCDAVVACGFAGPREVKILYSPLHGTGATNVLPVLRRDRFRQIEVFAPHAEPNGDFPNVPGHVANPEIPAVFTDLIERAQQIGADLVLASDPDADRIGCAAPLVPGGPWRVLTGNHIAVLLADFILDRRQAAGTLSRQHYVVKTLVTTPMLQRLAERYGVTTCGNVLTGFKWIGAVIDELGPERFVFAAEEAHGYLVGDYARDKDAAGAAMLLAELAAQARQQNMTLHQVLERLYERVGYHAELTASRAFPGAEGMAAMQAAMTRLRTAPPATLAGMHVARVRDYLLNRAIRPRCRGQTVDDKECDLLCFDLDRAGYSIAVRPSGTEPKLKCYGFGFLEAGVAGGIERARGEVAEKLARMQADLFAAAGLAT
jgi:phosphoglucomutase/phosphomannomutase